MNEEVYKTLILKASSYTAIAERSPLEVERKLYTWGGEDLDPEVVESIMTKLKQEGFIDPQRYADKYTRDKALHLHKGPNLIQQELYHKGIRDREIIVSALSSITDDEWTEGLRKYLTPKIESYQRKAHNRSDLSARLYSVATARGYKAETIRQFLQTLDLNSNDSWDETFW